LLYIVVSDVVDTVTFETETWSKLRERDRDFIKNYETEIETFETDTRKIGSRDESRGRDQVSRLYH